MPSHNDTKFASKSLIAEMTSPATNLFVSPQGRRALFYLLVPRTKRHFPPAQIAPLSETDETRSRLRRRPTCARRREPDGSLVAAEIMLFTDGDKSSASKALLRVIASSYPSTDHASPHPIDLLPTSRLYKALLQGGHLSHTSTSVERAAGWDASAFAAQFVTLVDKPSRLICARKARIMGCLWLMSCGWGAARGGEEEDEDVFGDEARAAVEGGQTKGNKVLLEKIALL
ncbi:hypothetical protein DXG01_006512 [Tephrocybe rancida]|nr:hypothetical protein DXG01_006512 [Tephrocybe rancida]